MNDPIWDANKNNKRVYFIKEVAKSLINHNHNADLKQNRLLKNSNYLYKALTNKLFQ